MLDLTTRGILRAFKHDRGFKKYFLLILINSLYSCVKSECMAYQRKYFSTQSICPLDRANIDLTLPKGKTCSWRSWKDTFCTALASHKLDKAMCSQRKIYRLSPTARPDVPRKCLDERHEKTIFVQPWQSSSVCYQLSFFGEVPVWVLVLARLGEDAMPVLSKGLDFSDVGTWKWLMQFDW